VSAPAVDRTKRPIRRRGPSQDNATLTPPIPVYQTCRKPRRRQESWRLPAGELALDRLETGCNVVESGCDSCLYRPNLVPLMFHPGKFALRIVGNRVGYRLTALTFMNRGRSDQCW
jgi:hypothetical protein